MNHHLPRIKIQRTCYDDNFGDFDINRIAPIATGLVDDVFFRSLPK